MCSSVWDQSLVQHAQLFMLVSCVLSALDILFTSNSFMQQVRCMVFQACYTVSCLAAVHRHSEMNSCRPVYCRYLLHRRHMMFHHTYGTCHFVQLMGGIDKSS